jgi:hypothetical protein
MKPQIRFRMRCLGFGVAGLAMMASTRAASEPVRPRATEKPGLAANANVAATPALTREEALKIITAARHYEAHPPPSPTGGVAEPAVTMPDFQMMDPPPPDRTETKPAAPGPGYVWVPGHYMPVDHQWRWVRGEWAVPALPISVWIPARYDPKERKWEPGYWQPDRPTTGETEPAKSDSAVPPRY